MMPLIPVRSILQGQDNPHLNLSKSSGKKTPQTSTLGVSPPLAMKVLVPEQMFFAASIRSQHSAPF